MANIPDSTFIHERATLVGDVRIGERCTILPGVVLRGDINFVAIGDGSNVQDNVVLHVTATKPCILGRGVTIGHGAIIHASVVEDNCLIGMNATLVNDVVIGKGSLVAAGALIPPGSRIPPHSLVVGFPGKVIRTDPGLEQQNLENAGRYHQVREAYLSGRFQDIEVHPPD